MRTDDAYTLRSTKLLVSASPASVAFCRSHGRIAASATRINDQFALFVSDRANTSVKTTGASRTERQLDNRSGFQRFHRTRPGPTRPQQERWVRNQLSRPMLHFALVVHAIEYEPWMRIRIVE